MDKDITVKLRAGKYLMPVTLYYRGSRIFVSFRYNKIMLAEIKNMQGAKWHNYDEVNPRKIWSIANCGRNQFQLDYMAGLNPYAPYETPIVEYTGSKRNLYNHQKEMVAQILTRHYCILACEMGVGKSLAAIEAMEVAGIKNEEAWYIGPKSGVKAIDLELRKWQSTVRPKLFTYEGLVKRLEHQEIYQDEIPRFVIFDESSKIKTPTSQRSQAAFNLAEQIREKHGKDGYVVLMTGTPAPKSPVDYWHQCLSADTWILTNEGYKQIRELTYQPVTIAYGNEKIKTKGFFKTGTKDVYKLITKEGYSLKATLNHMVAVDYEIMEVWKEIKDLVPGDRIKTAPICDIYYDGCNNNRDDGYLMGYLIGDGTISKDANLNYAYLSFYFDNSNNSILQEVKRILSDMNLYQSKENQLTCCHPHLNNLIRDFGLDSDKDITNIIKFGGSEFLKGFISGFFDADGNIKKSALVIRLTQVNIKRIKLVQLILSMFGIYSIISKRKLCTNIIIKGKVTKDKGRYDLSIYNNDAIRFNKLIEFKHIEKRQRIKEAIKNKRYHRHNNCATFESLEYIGKEDVYDIEVPEIHRFIANGLDVHNCETAMPGFLKEGAVNKFKMRLCLIQERESPLTGGVYPEIVTWFDNKEKCKTCGKLPEEHEDTLTIGHQYQESVNEVQYLYERMKGLVLVQFKKDCLQLPEKRYEIIQVSPTPEILRAAKLITATSIRAIEALTLLRELSDGFQYSQEVIGKEICTNCKGTKTEKDPESGLDIECCYCGGEGEVNKYNRVTHETSSPKDDILINELDSHDEIGRLIVWAGFTASIDRIIAIIHQYGWATLRVDGRGYMGQAADGSTLNDDELLIAMDASHPRFKELLIMYPRLCFVGHPQAGGMALTLTGSPTELFYSNCFNGEARMQAEDRFHRPGMDTNRGATIKDIIHLKTDQLVLDNLKKKKKLQSLSMGELADAINL